MYCRNCGKEIDDKAVVCVGCGVPPRKGSKFCPNCGKPSDANAAACLECGAALGSTIAGATDDKMWAMLAHLLGLFTSFIGPLVIWLTKGQESPFVMEQAKEALNFQISLLIYWIASGILSIIGIGLLMMGALWVFSLVVIIMASIAANEGRSYQYPLCIRFIK